jgi:hypothetical protein
VEVRIGVRDVAREVTFESAQSPEEVQSLVTAALEGNDQTLTLADEKGRTVVVPVQAIGYVEIGAPEKGKVGFGTR